MIGEPLPRIYQGWGTHCYNGNSILDVTDAVGDLRGILSSQVFSPIVTMGFSKKSFQKSYEEWMKIHGYESVLLKEKEESEKRKDWRSWKRKNFHPFHLKNRRHISNARVWRWNTKICPRFCMRQRSYINFFQMPLSRNTRVEQKTMAIVMHTTFPPIFQNEGMQIRSIP